MKTIIETPKGYKKVEKEVGGNTIISFESIKEGVVPESWEDFCKILPDIKSEYYLDSDKVHKCLFSFNRRIYPYSISTEQRAKAMLAFIQLIRVRDYINGDWTNMSDKKYIIHNFCGHVETHHSLSESHPLYFKTPEIRNRFLINFRDLIEESKEFI